MKVKITYESSAELANLLHRPLQEFIDQGAKMHKSDCYPPFRHAYITIGNGCGTKGSA